MNETNKNTFTGWLAGLITPEAVVRLLAVVFLLFGATAWNLFSASSMIETNTSVNGDQDDRLEDLDKAVLELIITTTTLNVNQEQNEKDHSEIKQMIRDIAL